MYPRFVVACVPAVHLLAVTLLAPAVFASRASALPLIPAPKEAHFTSDRLPLHDGLVIAAPPTAAPVAALLGEGLRTIAGIATTTHPTTPEAADIVLNLAPQPGGNPEGYSVNIGAKIQITASEPRGLVWGVQTLLQAIDVDHGLASLPCGEIHDAPSRAWRGLMLDPVRSFLDLGFIRRTIRVMSSYKLNTLQLHLIDDHAWRFESKAWPKCNRPGEPYYTQAELRELVAYAAQYGVEIVPEFDVPGHSMTAVDAYPELDCERKPRTMGQAIFCAGKPFTWEFIDRLVAEAADVFPSKYLHLGGDEPFALNRWATCPDCQARMKQKGVTSVQALYHTFLTDLNDIARRHRKQLILWNDAIHPGVEPMPPKSIIVDVWAFAQRALPLADAGYTLINASSAPLYLTSYGVREGLTLTAVCAWDAHLFSSANPRRGDQSVHYQPLSPNARVLGGHASAWATEQRLMEQRLYPRLLAAADRLWAEERPADAADFQARYDRGHEARLRLFGVPDDATLPTDVLAGSGVTHPSDANPLASEKAYRNFILDFDLRTPTAEERTGVAIRCANAGGASGFSVTSTPPPGWVLSRGLRSAKGWNHFQVVARNGLVSLTINGGFAWTERDPNPRAGRIVVGGGPGFEYRNVQIRSLDAEKNP